MNISAKIKSMQEVAVLEAELARRNGYKIHRYFPDEGPLRRDLYVKALEFFRGGKRFPERLLMGGNRTGKTEDAACECTYHLTGIYPPWWEGRRFDTPVDIWTAGDTATTTRDIQQLSLYGQLPASPKTGFIPAHLIKHVSPKHSVPNAVEMITVKHITGGDSTIQFKSYDQRREAFQGTAKHIVWLDEEPPEDIYTECLMRTLTVEGLLMLTFTPVEGLTPFVQSWLETGAMFDMSEDGASTKLAVAESMVFTPPSDLEEDVDHDAIKRANIGKKASIVLAGEKASVESVGAAIPVEARQRLITMISWDEVPHLSDAAKQQMITSIPAYQRAARTRGIPNLGSGVIYPINEDEIKVKPFRIPSHWKRGYGMDVGWNWTVAVHGAHDPETDIMYLYYEHYRSHAEPPVHAMGIKAMGEWIPGMIDPAANGRSQVDGKQLIQLYIDLGLKLDLAPNAVEAGVGDVWTRLTSSRLRVFSSMRHWFTEYRMYRRDPKGRVVKKNDHLMDATRYLIAPGVMWMQTPPYGYEEAGERTVFDGHGHGSSGGGAGNWMG